MRTFMAAAPILMLIVGGHTYKFDRRMVLRRTCSRHDAVSESGVSQVTFAWIRGRLARDCASLTLGLAVRVPPKQAGTQVRKSRVVTSYSMYSGRRLGSELLKLLLAIATCSIRILDFVFCTKTVVAQLKHGLSWLVLETEYKYQHEST